MPEAARGEREVKRDEADQCDCVDAGGRHLLPAALQSALLRAPRTRRSSAGSPGEQAQDDRIIIRAMMRPFLRIAGAVLALVLSVGAAHAGSLVEFANVSDQAQPARLLGYLTRPDGVAPFPAVVVLHGCNGVFAGYAEIADQLKSWGYVALVVDSFGPREISTRCGMGLPAQPTHSYAA